MPKSAEQKLIELEQKVRLLEKEKKHLEYQLARPDKKSILFDMMTVTAQSN